MNDINCSFCGSEFRRAHHAEIYCSNECRLNGIKTSQRKWREKASSVGSGSRYKITTILVLPETIKQLRELHPIAHGPLSQLIRDILEKWVSQKLSANNNVKISVDSSPSVE